ncbi:MAG: ATP-binding protein [Planctomycetota bacterium]
MEAEQLVDISPHVNQILADLERERFEWEGALGELIDNALDAKASRVVVEIDRRQRRVTVLDDGAGCDEPHRMFVSGDSPKKRGDALGRYGVGLKHASYYLARRDGTTKIVTSSDGHIRSIGVCWDQIVKRGAWRIEPPVDLTTDEAAALLPDGRGTRITFQMGKGRGFLASDHFEAMLQRLAFTFSPALRAGRQIRLDIAGGRQRPLAAPRDPVWSESIEFDVAIEHRKARVRAGILALDDKSGRRGLSYGFSHRVILQDTQSGAGDFSTAGWAGFVDLDAHWQLGQNKSAVTDDAWQQLLDAILERLRPLLEKLRNSTQQLHSEALRGATASLLNSCFVEGHGEPKRPHKHGEKREEPKKKRKRKVRRAAIVDGLGDVLGRRRGGGRVNIDWEDAPDAPHAARVDANGACVYLNRAKHIVGEAVAQQDSKLLAVIAAAHLFQSSTRNQLGFASDGEFGDLMGKLLSQPLVLTMAAKESA